MLLSHGSALSGGVVGVFAHIAHGNGVKESYAFGTCGVVVAQPQFQSDRVFTVLVALQVEGIFRPRAVGVDVAYRHHGFVVIAGGKADSSTPAGEDISLYPHGDLIIVVSFYRISRVGSVSVHVGVSCLDIQYIACRAHLVIAVIVRKRAVRVKGKTRVLACVVDDGSIH